MSAKLFTLDQIAQAVGAAVEGDGSAVISACGSLADAGAGEITFAADARRMKQLGACKATAALVPADAAAVPGLTLLRVADPEIAFVQVLGLFAPAEDLPPRGVDASAHVAADAKVDAEAAVGPNVVIGSGATIARGAVLCANVCVGAGSAVGEDTVLFPGVVVRDRCRVGKRCRIHPNSVIGADGFGYYFRKGQHVKVPHIGTVEIGDDVEIGACSCVDRAKFGVTRIGDGTKIDNLVQVAHNVQVGRGALLVAHVGLGGSVKLGDYGVLGGHSAIRDNVTVGAGLQVAAYSAVGQDMEGNQVVSGIPAFAAKDCYRSMQLYPKLHEFKKQIRELQARLDALEQSSKNNRP